MRFVASYRKISKTSKLYIRTEKQNLIDFPDVNAFLFTTRTYFYNVDELAAVEKKILLNVVEEMIEETKAYKGLKGAATILKEKLNDGHLP